MPNDSELIRKLAQLARLELSPEEEKSFGQQIPRILDYVGQLQKVTIEEAPPEELPPTEYREDKATPSQLEKNILNQAPEKSEGHWKVPSVF